MGIVNEYVKKITAIMKKNDLQEKPWLKYYKDVSEKLQYFNGSLYDSIKESSIKNEKRLAYTYFEATATYKDFIRQIDKVASCLKKYDVVENECVTICMPNTPEAIVLFYAINKVGAIANIVHPLASAQDIKRAIDETNSSILFCSDVAIQNAKEIEVENFILTPVSVSLKGIKKKLYNMKSKNNLILSGNMISWEQFIEKADETENTYVKRDSVDPAAIIYSGGTTGKTKGIILSNLNINAMAQQTQSVCKYVQAGNTLLSALPIFHVFGISVCFHTGLATGMTCIIVPKLNTKKINKELKKYQPTIFPTVPSLLKMVCNDKDPGKNAFKNIKVIVCGGDYLPNELRLETEAYFKSHGSDAKVKVGYGLSEASGFCCCTSIIDFALESLGIPNPDMNIKIVEPNSDIEREPNQVGEIIVSGPTVMMGYINEDEETKKTLMIHNDGNVWLHTGDLGYMTENGIIYYTSRIKRMIISNGYNIYPIELEEIISRCKYVETCTVVAMPHKIKNQVPKAVIVLKKDVENNHQVRNEVKEYCKENIAKYAIPYEYEFREEIPKTAIGKVAYRDLQEK